MIGCNMSYEVFYSDGRRFTLDPVSLSGVESESEREISCQLGMVLYREMEYTAELIYGMNGTTESKKILWPGEEYEEETSGVETEGEGRGRSGIVVIGVVIGAISGGVMLCILVTVCMCVRNRNREEKRRGTEMDEVMEELLIN